MDGTRAKQIFCVTIQLKLSVIPPDMFVGFEDNEFSNNLASKHHLPAIDCDASEWDEKWFQDESDVPTSVDQIFNCWDYF